MTLTKTKFGTSIEQCGMTKAQFQAYPFQPFTEKPNTNTYPIRNVTSMGFEGKSIFTSSGTWDSMPMKTDPYGFY